MSIPFLLDEKPAVVPVSSAGERSGDAREELPSSRFHRAKVYVDCNSFGPRDRGRGPLVRRDRIVCGTDGTEFGLRVEREDWTLIS